MIFWLDSKIIINLIIWKFSLEVISTLETDINVLDNVNKKINELNAIEPQILEYLEFLEKNKVKFIKQGIDL